MRKCLLLFILTTFTQVVFAQFLDNFSDGEFTNNPIWSGNVGVFEVDTTFKLHLNDTISGESFLATESNVSINAVWEFDVRLEFNSSSSNFAKVYLTADDQNLTADLNGFFVQIGGQTGATDNIRLYKQEGDTDDLLINGIEGIAAISPDLKIKVTRDSIGNWELFTDTSNIYFSEGTAFDNILLPSNYFGVYCKYTSTRAHKFWFDNFIVSGDSVVPATPQNISENDIIINEIFADPTPSIGLPEFEYIELYNNTNSTIDLTDWIITIETTEKVFPTSKIEPDSFVLLVKEDALNSFPSNISKIGFSSISLTNGGADIVLKDNNRKTINAISYTDKWYNNEDKSEGGWSIERANPNLYCERQHNWRASISNIGGTPGKQNSVWGDNVYIADFRITNAYIIGSNKMQVSFNKNLDSLLLSESSFFKINGNTATNSNPIAPFFDATMLTFDFTFLENTTYTISINSLIDCSGNSIINAMQFGIPDSSLENDIIINEILFNPKEDGVDYVEIYNNSNSFFDLSKLRIANFFECGGALIPENIKLITAEIHLFAPHTYLVLTSDSAKVKAQYYCENPYNFIEVESMPTLSNEEGTICIVHQSLNQIIDAFYYHEDMHFSLLEREDGVSLERLDNNNETQNTSNWHSAASTEGFGTPTYKNSQQYISQSIGEMNIDPKSFSPNNDGNEDVVMITWNFNKTNLMATSKIFDSEGRLVKNQMNNEMIGNTGSTTWDGTAENGLQLNTGMYIIWMEVFTENGTTERFKKVVVLSR
jgi:hypothetical protein